MCTFRTSFQRWAGIEGNFTFRNFRTAPGESINEMDRVRVLVRDLGRIRASDAVEIRPGPKNSGRDGRVIWMRSLGFFFIVAENT